MAEPPRLRRRRPPPTAHAVATKPPSADTQEDEFQPIPTSVSFASADQPASLKIQRPRRRRRLLRLDLSDSDDSISAAVAEKEKDAQFKAVRPIFLQGESENWDSCDPPDVAVGLTCDSAESHKALNYGIRGISRSQPTSVAAAGSGGRIVLPELAAPVTSPQLGFSTRASATAAAPPSSPSHQPDTPSPSLTPLSPTPAFSATGTAPSPPSPAQLPASSSSSSAPSSPTPSTPAPKKVTKLTFDSPLSPPPMRIEIKPELAAASSAGGEPIVSRKQASQRASTARQPPPKRRRIAVLNSDSDNDTPPFSGDDDDVQNVSPQLPRPPKSQGFPKASPRRSTATSRASRLLQSQPSRSVQGSAVSTDSEEEEKNEDSDDGPSLVAAVAASNQLWIDKYRPRSVAEVCMHKAKIAQVREWFGSRLNELCSGGFGALQQKALILSGPPGCGKSTLVQALAEELGLDVQSWCSPVQPDRWRLNQESIGFGAGSRDPERIGSYQDQASRSQLGDLRLPHETNLDHFRRFCMRSARYGALPLQLVQSPAHEPKESSKVDSRSHSSSRSSSSNGNGNGNRSGGKNNDGSNCSQGIAQREVIDLVDSDNEDGFFAGSSRRPPPMPPPPKAAAAYAHKLIVLEEYPFFRSAGSSDWAQHNQAKEALSQALLQILPRSRFLFVFLVSTENENQLFSLENLFTPELLESPWVAQIGCNPVYAKIMKNCLARILEQESITASIKGTCGSIRRKTATNLKAELARRLGPNFLDQLVENSRGDLRHAIQSLQFATTPGVFEGAEPQQASKLRRENSSESSQTATDREEGLSRVVSGADPRHSMIHGMGRILYARRDEKTGRTALEPVAALHACEEVPEVLNAYLHHNSIPALLSEAGAGSPAACDIAEVADMLHEFSAGDVLLKASERRFGNSTSACPRILSSAVCAWSYLNLRMRSGVPSLSPTYVRSRSRPGGISANGGGGSGRSSFGTKGTVSSRVTRLSSSRSQAALRLFRTPSCPQLFPGALETRNVISPAPSSSALRVWGSAAQVPSVVDEPDPDEGPDTAAFRCFPPSRQYLLLEVLPHLAVMRKYSRCPGSAGALPVPHNNLLNLISSFSAPGRPSRDSLAEFKIDSEAEQRALAWRDPLWNAPPILEAQRKYSGGSGGSGCGGGAGMSSRSRPPPVPTFSQPTPAITSRGQADWQDSFGLDSLEEAALLNFDFDAVTQPQGQPFPSAFVDLVDAADELEQVADVSDDIEDVED